MKKITYNFHKGKGLISKAIMLFSPNFSHVSFDLEDERWESQAPMGVQKGVYSPSPIVERYQQQVSNKRFEELKKWIEKQNGKDYDFFGVLANAPFGIFAKPIKGKFYCSELANVIYLKSKGVPSELMQRNKVTPAEFQQILKADKKIVELT